MKLTHTCLEGVCEQLFEFGCIKEESEVATMSKVCVLCRKEAQDDCFCEEFKDADADIVLQTFLHIFIVKTCFSSSLSPLFFAANFIKEEKSSLRNQYLISVLE